jgi:hypothetical protein
VILSRDAILGAKDDRIRRVEVPELGGEVCVGSLTVAEADRIRSLGQGGTPASVVIAVLTVCDEAGARLFTDADIETLKALPASAVTTIANAALEHNGLVEASAASAEKNSAQTPSGDSATD